MADTARPVGPVAGHTPISLDDVDHRMHHLIGQANNTPARDAALYHLSTGGHRMRARLALASAAAWLDESDAIAAAAACELLHNASLVHDDISDGDRLRRGHATVAARFGNDVALCAGDLLLTAAFEAASEIVHPATARSLSRAMARCAGRVIGGQSLELAHTSPPARVGFRDYLRATRDKTAPLIEVAIGAGLAAAPRPLGDLTPGHRYEEHAVRRLAEAIGLAYQILDDLDDLGETMPPSDEAARLHALHAWWHHQPPGQAATPARAVRTRQRCLHHVEAALQRAERLSKLLPGDLAAAVHALTRRLTAKAQAHRQYPPRANGE